MVHLPEPKRRVDLTSSDLTSDARNLARLVWLLDHDVHRNRACTVWKLSGLVTGAMTAVIGFGPTANAETAPSPEDVAAVAAIVEELATGSMGSSGSAGSSGSSGDDPTTRAPLPEPVAGEIPPVVTDPTAAARGHRSHCADRPASCRGAEFALPAYGILTSEFGDGRNHQGIDIAGPTGDPIFAASGGKVIDAGPAQGFGLWVRIEHVDGTITTYGHNDENRVKVGDVVLAGQQIATIGSRGDSTGPHLHFEVKLPDGKNTDPLAWLNERGVELAKPPVEETEDPAEEAIDVQSEAPAEAAPPAEEAPPVEIPVEAPPAPPSDPAIAV